MQLISKLIKTRVFLCDLKNFEDNSRVRLVLLYHFHAASFFESYGLGESSIHLHVDNFAGQNKNRFMI